MERGRRIRTNFEGVMEKEEGKGKNKFSPRFFSRFPLSPPSDQWGAHVQSTPNSHRHFLPLLLSSVFPPLLSLSDGGASFLLPPSSRLVSNSLLPTVGRSKSHGRRSDGRKAGCPEEREGEGARKKFSLPRSSVRLLLAAGGRGSPLIRAAAAAAAAAALVGPSADGMRRSPWIVQSAGRRRTESTSGLVFFPANV